MCSMPFLMTTFKVSYHSFDSLPRSLGIKSIGLDGNNNNACADYKMNNYVFYNYCLL